MLATGWQDGALQSGAEYDYTVTVLHADGRAGSTQVMVETPLPVPPTLPMPRGAQLASADGVLRLTPCAQRTTGGPATTAARSTIISPGWVAIEWDALAPATHWVVERQLPTGAWKLIGSTCGGPMPVSAPFTGRTGTSSQGIRDATGGLGPPGTQHLYRVTAVGPSGEVGWYTHREHVPCVSGPQLFATVSGSTVTLTWSSGSLSVCGMPSAVTVERTPRYYTVTSSYGYVKTRYASTWSKEPVFGVPLGTHTFSIVGEYPPDGRTTTRSVTVTVAY